ncbi:DUF4007 family protein [uncultured Alteromonas sp.]|uniref:DUF4007 family protein n=1 Tax=uncultured Alteromonas sp. TaxID=179113 RepID=UPI0030DC2ECE
MEPKFSGHETFPLRYGWLYKSANLLKNKSKLSTSNSDDVQKAIIELGVGKNMVSAIRYWSEACSIIKTQKNDASQSLTAIGEYLFVSLNEKKIEAQSEVKQIANDPYLERLGTIWLIHFLMNFNEDVLTTYRYFFNMSATQTFEKSSLIYDIDREIKVLCDKEVKENTIKKDVECFLNTYSSKQFTKDKKINSVGEEHFASPLIELGLVRDLGKGNYLSLLEERPSLPTEIFAYALLRFVSEIKASETAGFDALLSDQCSPGKIFRLSERGLGVQLDNAVKQYPSLFEETDTQGMRQVRVLKTFNENENFQFILDDYYRGAK